MNLANSYPYLVTLVSHMERIAILRLFQEKTTLSILVPKKYNHSGTQEMPNLGRSTQHATDNSTCFVASIEYDNNS